MKSLIIYFSREGENIVDYKFVNLEVGNTEVIAKKIASLTNGHIFKIEPLEKYPLNYDECNKIAEEESLHGTNRKWKTPVPSLNEYDVIYVGFPIWFRSYPRIVGEFLKQYDFSNKKVKLFCTNDEGSFGTAELELRSILKGAFIKSGLAIRGVDIYNSDDKLSRWVNK